MESFIIPVITTIAGVYFLVRNVALLRDQKKLAAYIQTSLRAKLWVEKYGVERATHIATKYLLPLGVVIAAVLLSVGLLSLAVLVLG